MARRDRAAPARRGEDALDHPGGGLAMETSDWLPPTGPHDGDDLDPELTDAAGLVDFGAIRVPVPAGGTVTVEPTANGRMQAVHIALPEGRLSVSALAAPKSSKLWPELAREIDTSLREGGARVRSFPGDWGRELHATSGGATSVFVGVDGARWMVYGVATGPTTQAAVLDNELRRMLRGTVVVRGKQPFPVRTILPLVVPDHLADADAAGSDAEAAPASAKKRSAGKPGAGRSAPGKAVPGKTAPRKSAPAKSDTSSAAAKKAARRAAARKAAAAAAVKAAAEALAEQAAEDRAADEERPADTGGAARGARTGAHPRPESMPGTIPTGPGPDAPLREQAPSARRAAAAWGTRPSEPGWERSSPTAATAARPDDVPPVTDAFPAARADAPPTDALPVIGPGEPASVPDLPPGGRRRLREPADAPRPDGRRNRREPPGQAYAPGPPAPGTGGRRRRGEPAAEAPPPGRRHLREPDVPADLERPGGRRHLREPAADVGATGPWDVGKRDLGPPDGGRQHRAEPGRRPEASGGRRRLREPLGEPGRGGAGPREPGADTGGSGRRPPREPWDEVGRAAGPPPWEAGPGGRNGSDRAEPAGRRRVDEPFAEHGRTGADIREPRGSGADAGVSEPGRRRMPESSWDEVAPGHVEVGHVEVGRGAVGRGAEPWETGPDALNGPGLPGSGGRRRLGEPERAGADPWDSGRSGGPAADAGVPRSGRRRSGDGFGRGPEPWESGADGVNGSGASGSGGRWREEPFGEPGQADVDRQDPGGSAVDGGVSGSGRRPLVRDGFGRGPEPWRSGPDEAHGPGLPGSGGRRRLDETERAGADPWNFGDDLGRGTRPRETGPDGVNGAARSGAGGRRRREEPFGGSRADADLRELGGSGADVGVSGTGRRRRLEGPLDEPGRDAEGPVRGADVPPREYGTGPAAAWPDGHGDGADRRHLREPFGAPRPVDGREPWETGADGPGGMEEPAHGGRRHLREPSGLDAGWGDGAVSGTGGRRRRQPDPVPPVGDGVPDESWRAGLDEDVADGGPQGDRRRGRRPGGADHLVDTGEQDADWAVALDARAEPRRGRYVEEGPGEPPRRTVPLRTLLGDLDPNRPSGRHRRSGH